MHQHKMKKAIVWILLTSYLSASCAGLMPLVSDVIAHILWHKAHIEHVHHGTEGHTHVAAEIAQVLGADQNQSGTFSQIPTNKINVSAHYFLLASIQPCATFTGSFVAFPSFSFRLPTGVESSIFLPPKRA